MRRPRYELATIQKHPAKFMAPIILPRALRETSSAAAAKEFTAPAWFNPGRVKAAITMSQYTIIVYQYFQGCAETSRNRRRHACNKTGKHPNQSRSNAEPSTTKHIRQRACDNHSCACGHSPCGCNPRIGIAGANVLVEAGGKGDEGHVGAD